VDGVTDVFIVLVVVLILGIVKGRAKEEGRGREQGVSGLKLRRTWELPRRPGYLSSLGVRTLNLTIGPFRLLLMGALLRRRRLSILASEEKKRVATQYPAKTATSPMTASTSAFPKFMESI
jgi:hypothetical protein